MKIGDKVRYSPNRSGLNLGYFYLVPPDHVVLCLIEKTPEKRVRGTRNSELGEVLTIIGTIYYGTNNQYKIHCVASTDEYVAWINEDRLTQVSNLEQLSLIDTD